MELGYPPGLVRIIPNGLDWGDYETNKPPEKEDTAAYVGRIAPYKRIEDLVRAGGS